MKGETGSSAARENAKGGLRAAGEANCLTGDDVGTSEAGGGGGRGLVGEMGARGRGSFEARGWGEADVYRGEEGGVELSKEKAAAVVAVVAVGRAVDCEGRESRGGG